MNANEVLRLARRNMRGTAAMESSARLCFADAIALFDRGQYDDAKMAAVRSLKYSVGVFHPDYQKAAKSVDHGHGAATFAAGAL